MERDRRDTFLMATLVKSVKALLGLVVPNFDESVIRAGDEMRSLQVAAEVQTVDTCIVTNQSVIGCRLGRAHCPNLDCLVQGCRAKHGGVLRIDLDLHDVVIMIAKRVNFSPVFVPVEHSNGIVIRARDVR